MLFLLGLMQAHSEYNYFTAFSFMCCINSVTHPLQILTHSQTAEPLNCYLHSCCVFPLWLSSHPYCYIPATLQEWETAELKVSDSGSGLSPSPQTQLFYHRRQSDCLGLVYCLPFDYSQSLILHVSRNVAQGKSHKVFPGTECSLKVVPQ